MLRKLKIALRLSASFAVLLVFLVGGTGVGLLSTGLLHQRMSVMISQDWVSAQSAATLKDLPQDSATALLDLFRVTDPDEMEKLVNRVYANRTNFVSQLKGIEALATAAEEKTCVAKIREGSQTFDTSTDKVIEMFLQGRRAEAVEFLSRDSMVKLAPLQGTLKNLFDAQGADMKRSGEQADSAYQTNRLLMIILGGAAILAGAALAFFVTRSIVQPVRQADVLVTAVAAGDLTVSLETDSRDEIGDITRQLNSMVTKLRSQFGTLKRNSGELQESSGRLGTYSTQVSANSEETSVQVSVVAAAAEQVSKNVATVATAAEEMTAAIREVAQQASEAANVAGRAVQVAATANRTISKLGDSSTQIGNVIKVINSIAEQTNLLALNATIEAARAGEAGKGFAVVANEVKELARQTAKATEEISQRINSIQSDTAASVSAIQEISGIIAQINQIQTVIAGSVEEQAVTTNEISKNATEAATGSAEIARNITGVSDAALSSTKAATNVAGAAGELGRLAVELNRFAGQFRIDASAADTASPSRASAASETGPSDLIQWDPARMATGVATVDEQHQELITRINQLQTAIRNCAGADEIEPMLAYLGDYTVKHFSHEEGLMESHACPSRQANLEAHQRFLENFTALAETYRRKGPTMEVLETLKKTVQDWLVNHICTIDHKLKGCTAQHANGNGSSHGNGKANGRASIKFHASKRG